MCGSVQQDRAKAVRSAARGIWQRQSKQGVGREAYTPVRVAVMIVAANEVEGYLVEAPGSDCLMMSLMFRSRLLPVR